MAKLWRFNGKALSVTQPWASAIAFGGKDIENKSLRTHFRGALAIHASLTYFPKYFTRVQAQVPGGKKKTIIEWINEGHKKYGQPAADNELIHGHIIAIAMIVDCRKSSKSPWYFKGNWAWVIGSVVPIEPIPATGALGLWDCKIKYKPLVRV